MHGWHWALGAAVVVVCAVAVVATAGGATAGIAAVAAVGNGMTASTTASTIAAGAFIGSATIYGMSAISAATTSSSVNEFNSKGNWGTVTSTIGGVVLGGGSAYINNKSSTSSPKTSGAVSKSSGTSSKPVGKPFAPKGPKVNSQRFSPFAVLYGILQLPELSQYLATIFLLMLLCFPARVFRQLYSIR